jgi:signal transduction histidine kinase
MIPGRMFRSQLAVSHFFLVLVVVFALGLYFISQQHQPVTDLMNEELAAQVSRLAPTASTGPDNHAPRPDIRSIDAIAFRQVMYVLRVSPDSQVTRLDGHPVDDQEGKEAVEVARLLTGHPASSYDPVLSYTRQGVQYSATVIAGPGESQSSVLCLALPIGPFEQASNHLRSLFLGGAAGATLLFLGVAARAAALLVQPLKNAGQQVERIASGDYTKRLPESGPSEIASLARTINLLSGELEKQQFERRLVLANTTHELARPLGALRLGVDSLRSGALNDSELADDLLNEMNQTLQRMEALIDDLAMAARPVGSSIALDLQSIPIEPLLQGLRSLFWQRAEGRGVELFVTVQPGTPPVLADEIRLNQVLANLLDNALKFSPTNSCIRLCAGSCSIVPKGQPSQRVWLDVMDSGPGIPEQDLPNVFEPFYQVDNIKGVHQGMGLGLSIVRQLVRAQGGTIELTNLPEGGLRARLTLPTAEEDKA